MKLLDIITLRENLPELNLYRGQAGTIVECFNDDKYEVEFSNEDGETTALCTLSPQQFIVVWQAQTQSWLSVSDKLTAVIDTLSEDK